MFRMKLLSRYAAYTALHGIKNDKKDYLSIIKDQGNEGFCWAYSLTSSVEMKYALSSGNRLMLDPFSIVNNSVKWFNRHKSTHKDSMYSNCFQYDEGGYPPLCALEFMYGSKQELQQMDGNNSHLIISNADVVSIDSVSTLFEVLDKYDILYSMIASSELPPEAMIIDDYVEDDELLLSHAIVITSVGVIEGFDGIYVEVLNSWGYNYHYDGIVYVKVADNETDELHNSFKIFDFNSWIMVEKQNYFNSIYMLMWIFLTMLIVESSVLISICIIVNTPSCRDKFYHSFDPPVINNEINNEINDELETKSYDETVYV